MSCNKCGINPVKLLNKGKPVKYIAVIQVGMNVGFEATTEQELDEKSCKIIDSVPRDLDVFIMKLSDFIKQHKEHTK